MIESNSGVLVSLGIKIKQAEKTKGRTSVLPFLS